ncbi:hypothetical protein TNIN_276901 [Trichonephila inaurata madagascariensis]|uniref:Uncharacterized protein n=1 Tax=Trichonephila inaurata madagascariensis TaxID=2747483 RepID=A0A8X7CRI2_9ARAC|nr:hypothetical protein TNIN_276901 [Trichonephila inaurata madagascariensis]
MSFLADQHFIQKILQPHTVVDPLLNSKFRPLFQQENAQPHTFDVSRDNLQHFDNLLYLAFSPDFSPIEKVWVLKHCINLLFYACMIQVLLNYSSVSAYRSVKHLTTSLLLTCKQLLRLYGYKSLKLSTSSAKSNRP